MTFKCLYSTETSGMTRVEIRIHQYGSQVNFFLCLLRFCVTELLGAVVSCELLIIIVQPVSVTNQFSMSVVFLQHICKLCPSGRSACCRSFPHQVIEQINGMRIGDNLTIKYKFSLGTPRYVWIVLDMTQKL